MINQNHFEDVGYAYVIVYGQLVGLVSGVIDPEFEFLPKLDRWSEEALRLHDEKHEGFCKGSNVMLPPVGLHAIYEGQARFIQLDFLNRARSEPLTCAEWRAEGYLSGGLCRGVRELSQINRDGMARKHIRPHSATVLIGLRSVDQPDARDPVRLR